MRRVGAQGCVRVVAVGLFFCACRSTPVPRAPRPPPQQVLARTPEAPPQAGPAQPGRVLAEVNGTLVVALAAPQFAQLPRDQRVLAYQVAQAGAAGDAVAIDQSYRRNLQIVR